MTNRKSHRYKWFATAWLLVIFFSYR